MRTFLLASLVVVSGVLGATAVAGVLVLPGMLGEPLVEELVEAGLVREVRIQAAERIVQGVREETEAPVRRTAALQEVMAEALTEAWFREEAAEVVEAAAAALEGDRPGEARVDLRGPKERLAGRWPAVLRALYDSLPECGPDQDPRTFRCRSPEVTDEELVATAPGPRLVLRNVPDRVEVGVLGRGVTRAPLSFAYREGERAALGELAVLALLILGAPPGGRTVWLGRGVLLPGLLVVGAGLLLLVLGVLVSSGLAGAVVRAAVAVYAPVLLGGAVAALVGGMLAFR